MRKDKLTKWCAERDQRTWKEAEETQLTTARQ